MSAAGYAIAVAGVCVSFAMLWAWWESLRPALSSPFLVIITLSAWIGGIGPGLLATGLSVVASTWLVTQRGDSSLFEIDEVLRAGSYLMVALLTTALNNARKRAEEAMRERDQRLQLVSEQIPAGLWSTDPELRLTSAFGASLAMNGKIGQSLWEHFHTSDENYPPIAAHLRALEGQSAAYEQAANGRTFQAHVEPLRGVDGRIIGVVGVNIDITQRKRAEEGLKGAKEQAEAAITAKDQFLAMLSHELRTPLTPVLAAASALEMQTDLPTEVIDDVRMMRRNIELEATLIDDLLDVTRITRGKLRLRRQNVDIHAVLQNAIDICREDIDSKQIRLDARMSATASTVRGDPARLQQVFWNLIKNAVKFSSPDGVIEVRTADAPDRRVRVTVRDYGIGIEPHLLPRIFDAFEQGRAAITREFGGLGLGLSISKALIDEHGGRLWAESAGRGKGASFFIELETVPVAATALRSPTTHAEAPVEHAPSPLRILLVEDHLDTLRMMERLLSRSGYHVLTASSAREAIEQSQSHDIDMIISDLGLPDGSGLDVVRRISAVKPVKSIALSGFGMEADVEKSRQAGFTEHLTKPVNFQTLEMVIERLAGKSSTN